MLDIPSISTVVASIGVIVGVAFTVLELRNLVKTRQTDLVMRIYSTYTSKEYLEALEKLRDREIMDSSHYQKKYGFTEFNQVGALFEQVGFLLHRKLVDVSVVHDLFRSEVSKRWKKMESIIQGRRKDNPNLFEWFEYLYNEIQRREQRLQQIQQ